MALVKTSVLGRGATSIVFKAVPVHMQNGEDGVRAVKSSRLFPVIWKEESILRDFIGCPEILQCYGSQITTDNGLFVNNLIMEFSPHGTLKTLLMNKPLAETEIKVYTCMILKGLSCIHQKKLVHCDLKPENILLFPSSQDDVDYQLKIADFGVSRTKEEKIDPKFWRLRFRGTPYYMSPESLALGQIEAPLDIWSLGCIVIEMITGKPAWHKLANTKVIMYKLAIQEEAPEIPNGVSEECIDFLSKCLDLDHRSRWTADMLLCHPFIRSHRSVY